MGATGVHPQREDGRMLQKPDLIGACGAALGGQALHGAPRGLVVDAPKMTDERRWGGMYRLPCRRRLAGLRGIGARRAHGVPVAMSRPALLRLSACSAR